MMGVERSTAADPTGDDHPTAVFRQDVDRRRIGSREDRPHDAACEESNPLLVAPRSWSLFTQALTDQRRWQIREQPLYI
jgi:hypothetical protein